MNQWVTIEAERVLYVSDGRHPIVCDRGHAGPVTLIVKLRNLEESAVRTMNEKLFKAETSQRTPVDSTKAFAYLVSKCAEGFGRELLESGKTETEARNAIINYFLDFAAGEACRVARREQREPDPAKWRKATGYAFQRAVKRTADNWE